MGIFGRQKRNLLLLWAIAGILLFDTGHVFGGGATASITLQPVQPPTGQSYPPGTTIVDQEIILGSVPARVWLELQVTGWAPDVLKRVQGTISATDLEQDGGGYSGNDAICNGQPGNGGNLTPPLIPCGGTCSNDPSKICASNLECRTCEGGSNHGLPCSAWFQCPAGTCPSTAGRTCVNPHEVCRVLSGPVCEIEEVSKCVRFDGIPPSEIPAGYFCAAGFQNKCHPSWGAQGVVANASVDLSSLDFRFGFTCDLGEVPIDFAPSYFGTLVLDVPVDAKGTYTIDFDETQTFLLPNCRLGECEYPIPYMPPALITVPCGRCCSGYASGDVECVDHVGIGECSNAADQVFTADEVCPQAGGSECAECASDGNCADGLYCNGVEMCEGNVCGPGQPPCGVNEVCEEDRDYCSPRIPAVSHWGMIILGLAVLVGAKLRWKPVLIQASD